ncbi:MAG: O-antigen ligase family protein [Bacteroidia bacterium]|jgi:O-antigen ligase|nr:O-antigen ligase family protein [Bacteroidia bacterium]
MLKILRGIGFEKWAFALCVLLCAVSMYAIAGSRYVLIYIPVFIAFAGLLLGYFLLNKQNLLKLLFFMIPLSVGVTAIGEAEIQTPTEPMIGLLMILLVATASGFAGLRKDMWSTAINRLLLFEIIWLVVCSMTSQLNLVSFKYTFIRICYAGVFFFLALQWMRHEKKPEKFYQLYILGMIFPIIVTLIKHAALEFSPRTAYHMPKPFYNDHTVFGACLAFVIPFVAVYAFAKKEEGAGRLKKYGYAVALVALLIVEFLSFSRAAWLSLGAALGLYLLVRLRANGRVFLMLLMLAGGTVYLAGDFIMDNLTTTEAVSSKGDVEQHFKSITNIETDASNKERINRWKCAIRMGEDKPVFGYGPRTYKYYYGQFQTRENMTHTSTFSGTKGHAHSDYLAFFAESGWIGLLLHIALFVAVVMKGLNVLRRKLDVKQRNIALAALLGFFTYFIHGIFNGFMEEEKMASLVFFSMAVIVYIDEQTRNTDASWKTQSLQGL